jgi:ribokinase
VQLQQPAAAVLTAAVLAGQAGCRVLLDGAPPDGVDKEALLSAADVVRADARETELLTGNAIGGPGDAARAAAAILGQGPALAALAVGDAGNYFAWRDPVWGTGELLLPLARTPVADTTGAGDAFTAALIAGLDQLQDPRGGRPHGSGRSRAHCRPPWRPPGAELGAAQEAIGRRVNARRPASRAPGLRCPGHRGSRWRWPSAG